jgi:hypothetical protein
MKNIFLFSILFTMIWCFSGCNLFIGFLDTMSPTEKEPDPGDEPFVSPDIEIPAFTTWCDFTISCHEIKWLYFNGSANYGYYIEWDDLKDGSSCYTADIVVTAYTEDKRYQYFEPADTSYGASFYVQPEVTEKVYLKVEEFLQGSSCGSFAVQIMPVAK